MPTDEIKTPESTPEATSAPTWPNGAPAWLMPDPGEPGTDTTGATGPAATLEPAIFGIERALLLMTLSRLEDYRGTNPSTFLRILTDLLDEGLADIAARRQTAGADTGAAPGFADALRAARERLVDARSDLRGRQDEYDTISAFRTDHIIRTRSDAGQTLGSNDAERKRNLAMWIADDDVIRAADVALEGARVAAEMAELEVEHIRDMRRDYENGLCERESADR